MKNINITKIMNSIASISSVTEKFIQVSNFYNFGVQDFSL